MSEITQNVKVTTIVHHEIDDGRVHVTHTAIPQRKDAVAVEFSFSMDVLSANIMAAQIQVAIDKIHMAHAATLPNKTYEPKSGNQA